MDIEVVGLSSKQVNVMEFSAVTALLTHAQASFWASAVAFVVEYTGVMCGISDARIPDTVTLCV